MAEQVQKTPKSTIINSIIGVAIMFIFPHLPITLVNVTPVGMEVIGVFLGTLYLWSTVDIMWSSLLSLCVLGMTSYADMPTIMGSFFGNGMLMQILFIMLFTNALTITGVTNYVARFFLSRKVMNGRPYVFLFTMMLASFLVATFCDVFAALFLFWPVTISALKELDYETHEKFATISIILICISALIGFPVAPYKSNSLALLTNFQNITSEMACGVIRPSDAGFFFTDLILSLLLMVLLVLIVKFVLRPDVSKMKKLDTELLNRHPLPPMSLQQKVLGSTFMLLVLCMLVPALFPTAPILSTLKAWTYGIPMLFCAVLCAIRIERKPLMDIQKCFSTGFAWGSVFLMAQAILLGSVLTNESTGVSAFLSAVLSPIFNGMNSVTFVIMLLVLCMVLTNICNSLVIGMIMQPVVATFAASSGANAAPIVSLMIMFVLMSAAITPAASPFAALLHAQKDKIHGSDIYKYATLFVLVELVVFVVIGIPLANLLIH